jgi:hypothetical protein
MTPGILAESAINQKSEGLPRSFAVVLRMGQRVNSRFPSGMTARKATAGAGRSNFLSDPSANVPS